MPEQSQPPAVPSSWFASVVENALDYAFISMDVHGVITHWNAGAERLFLYQPDEVCGALADLIFTPEDVRAGVPIEERRLAKLHGSTSDERWHLRKDNSRFWAAGRMMVVRDSIGAPLGLVKIVQDRTSDKRVLDELRRAGERHRLLNRATNDVIWDWDLRTGELSWNDAVLAAFGVTAAELGSSLDGWSGRIHPDERSAVTASLLRAIDGGDTRWSNHYRFLCRNGEYAMFFDRGFIAREPDGTAFRVIGSMLNITHDLRASAWLRDAQATIERQNADLEIRVQQRTAQLANALHDMEAFSYSVSHDLKAPANTAHALAELLLHEELSPAERTDIAQRIHRNTGQMCSLIRDMLRFSRIGRGGPLDLTPVDLDEILDLILADAAPVIAASRAQIDVRRPLGHVMAARELLRHAASNLLSNALKFVRPGVAPRVTISTERRDSRLRLRVRDNGIGIEPRFRDQIFELFARLHAGGEYPGHGIGLATVKRSAEQMGGSVGFESVLGHGSTFFLELPAAPPPEDPKT